MLKRWNTIGRGMSFSALGATLSACIGAPGIPGGPLQGTGLSVSGSYGYALAPAHITMRSKTSTATASYWDPAADAVNIPIWPSRLGGRVGVTDWFDAAGDISYTDCGFEFRAGLPEGAQPLPLALAVGMRRGSCGLLQMQNRYSSEQRLRLEAYPRLARFRSARLNLISSLGLSTGRRFHPSQLPQRLQSSEDEDGVPGPNMDPQILRDETRLEASAGLELRQSYFFASAVLMPYVVTHSGRPATTCDSCDDWELTHFRANFGAALFLSFGLSFTLEHERGVGDAGTAARPAHGD